jgi:4-amino-4-deoxy-L-arabinose transferase-like glycosyltransferase
MDDSITYLSLAHGLPFEYARFPAIPDVQRPPGYPVFLYLFYFLTGGGAAGVIVAQKMLVFLTAWGLYKICALFSTRADARASALLYLFMPYPALMSCLLLTETAFVAAAVWGTYAVMRGRMWTVGVVFAAGMLTKPWMVVVMGIGVGYLGVRGIRERRFPKKAWALFLIPALGWWGWRERNARVADVPTFSMGGRTANLYGIAAGLDAAAAGHVWNDTVLIFHGEKRRGPTRYVGDFPAQETAVFAAPFPWREMTQRPGATVVFYFRALKAMFTGVGYGTAKFISRSRYVATAIAFWGGIVIFVVWTAGFLPRRHWGWERTALWFIAWTLVCTHATAWSDGRYRMPADVFILAAATPHLWNLKRFLLFATARPFRTEKTICNAA